MEPGLGSGQNHSYRQSPRHGGCGGRGHGRALGKVLHGLVRLLGMWDMHVPKDDASTLGAMGKELGL